MTLEIAFDRDGEAVAEAELAQVFIDADSGEKVAIPDDVREALERYA
jgi:acyl-CoA thioesterase FadM